MKKIILFTFAATMAAGCTARYHSPDWYGDLRAVDRNWISDSLIRAIACDSSTVKEILVSAGWVLDSSADTLHPNSVHVVAPEVPPGEVTYYGGRGSHLHNAIMDDNDSFEAVKTLRSDSIVLELDSLTLAARSGNPEAQRKLSARHAIEGDINGLWTSDALMIRDDSMRSQLIETRERFIRSDSAKAMLDRLGK